MNILDQDHRDYYNYLSVKKNILLFDATYHTDADQVELTLEDFVCGLEKLLACGQRGICIYIYVCVCVCVCVTLDADQFYNI